MRQFLTFVWLFLVSLCLTPLSVSSLSLANNNQHSFSTRQLSQPISNDISNDNNIPTTSSIKSSLQILAQNDLSLDFKISSTPSLSSDPSFFSSYQLLTNPKSYNQAKRSCNLLSENLIPSNTRIDKDSALFKQLKYLNYQSVQSVLPISIPNQYWIDGGRVLTYSKDGNVKISKEPLLGKKLMAICSESAQRHLSNNTDTDSRWKVGVKTGQTTVVG